MDVFVRKCDVEHARKWLCARTCSALCVGSRGWVCTPLWLCQHAFWLSRVSACVCRQRKILSSRTQQFNLAFSMQGITLLGAVVRAQICTDLTDFGVNR